MKIEKVSGSQERSILTALIVSTPVLARVSSKWNPEGLFSSREANLIASWCVKYFKKYEKAPKKAIQNIYYKYASSTQDKTLSSLMEGLLSSLSQEYEIQEKEINSEYILDLAGDYFDEVKLRKLSEEIQAHLSLGQVSRAREAYQSYSRVELSVGSGVDLFLDKEEVLSTFSYENNEVLIEYPGALGQFFGNTFEREGFVAIMAQQKTFKSYWLLDLAYRAMLQRRKVAYFVVGDMSKVQVKKRILVRNSKHPLRAGKLNKWPYEVKWPEEIKPPLKRDEYLARVKFSKRIFQAPLDGEKAWQACERLMNREVKSKSSYFKLSCHPVSSVNILQIKNILDEWEKDGFTCDVCIIDYSDNLAPIDPKDDKRDRINETWKMMRALCQIKHILLITATQVKASAFGKTLMDRTDFADDSRKFNHVTAMYGLNQMPSEKELGVMRVQSLLEREDFFSPRQVCYVAPCIALANPAVVSCF